MVLIRSHSLRCAHNDAIHWLVSWLVMVARLHVIILFLLVFIHRSFAAQQEPPFYLVAAVV